ncbi:glycosyltransferase family 9 protein [Bdellovibrio sp. ZAP7]|uniref:glycosyltransferase family 9 protein n=1 Tax=Bdellovibrio sp. ZAP7 TaxID=2231053 RepID=UPI00115A6499|nr:glycosyltransferase family 9 protein [Bdellovibrio sp. ZAP7]QDK45106.1 glycosyltransferase family 9 protein [Bdellovibrio sp. ZAP7]
MPLNLVVQTAFLGDLLLAIPLLKRCRQIWPDHKLGLVCRKGFGDFFLKTHLVDHVFEIKKGDADSYNQALNGIAQHQVNYLVSPHESLRTIFFCRKITAQHKIGFKKFWSFLAFSQTVKKPMLLPDPLRQMSLLQEVDPKLKDLLASYAQTEKPYTTDFNGKLSAPPEWSSMSVRAEVLKCTDAYRDLEKRYDLKGVNDDRAILMFPGSVWATKRWTKEGFIDTGKSLQSQGYQVYVMGGPGEEKLAEEVSEAIPGSLCIAGKTSILESTQIIARARLLVGNDSAASHMAAACETPLISVFGPTVLRFGFRPWSASTYIAQKENLPCRPCGKHGHQKCPIKTHVCMTHLPAEQVVQKAEFILRS